jgi:hypothetical protein
MRVQGEYRAAHEVARGAGLLQAADMAATQAAHDAACALRAGRLCSRHAAEMGALKQRAEAGRCALELRRGDEAARRAARYRVAAAELERVQRLEEAHLKGFLMSPQVRGGPRHPSPGSSLACRQRTPQGRVCCLNPSPDAPPPLVRAQANSSRFVPLSEAAPRMQWRRTPSPAGGRQQQA